MLTETLVPNMPSTGLQDFWSGRGSLLHTSVSLRDPSASLTWATAWPVQPRLLPASWDLDLCAWLPRYVAWGGCFRHSEPLSFSCGMGE